MMGCCDGSQKNWISFQYLYIELWHLILEKQHSVLALQGKTNLMHCFVSPGNPLPWDLRALSQCFSKLFLYVYSRSMSMLNAALKCVFLSILHYTFNSFRSRTMPYSSLYPWSVRMNAWKRWEIPCKSAGTEVFCHRLWDRLAQRMLATHFISRFPGYKIIIPRHPYKAAVLTGGSEGCLFLWTNHLLTSTCRYRVLFPFMISEVAL